MTSCKARFTPWPQVSSWFVSPCPLGYGHPTEALCLSRATLALALSLTEPEYLAHLATWFFSVIFLSQMLPSLQQVFWILPPECNYYSFHLHEGLFPSHHQILPRKLLHFPCFYFVLHNRNHIMPSLCLKSSPWLPIVLKIKPTPHPMASEATHMAPLLWVWHSPSWPHCLVPLVLFLLFTVPD